MTEKLAKEPSAEEISRTLTVWILAEDTDEIMPDLAAADHFSVHRFGSTKALIHQLTRQIPDCLALVGRQEVGTDVRRFRELAPSAAIIVWSSARDKTQVAQALAAGAQIFSTDKRIAMLAPRIRDAVARQQRSILYRGRIENRLEILERERERSIALTRSVATAMDRDLTALLGHLDRVYEHIPELSPSSEHLELIDVCGSRAAELAQELASYTGSRRVVAEPLDVSELAEDMQVLLRACLTPNHNLVLNPGFNLPLVEADRALIRRLVVDLVLITAQSPGVGHGALTLSTGARECHRELLQEMRGGDGMRTGRFVYLEAAVDLMQGASSSNHTIQLEGLDGLESVLREHYGGLRLFRHDRRVALQAFLPAFDRSSDDETPLAKGWHDGGSILLIEPNELARASVIPTLERLGFEVETAEDGSRALECFATQEERFASIIVDANLDQPTTESLINSMLNADPGARIIVSSGRSETEVMPQFNALGVSGFIRKPFRVVNLRRIFRQTLDFDEGSSGPASDDDKTSLDLFDSDDANAKS